PKRMGEFRQRYEHHLLLKVSAQDAAATEAWLRGFFNDHEGGYFHCTADEGRKAFLHRFAVAGAAVRYREVHRRQVQDIVALDIA
ncbi:D-lactate dehydrogenase, partial [Variovorax sp. 2RAF20]